MYNFRSVGPWKNLWNPRLKISWSFIGNFDLRNNLTKKSKNICRLVLENHNWNKPEKSTVDPWKSSPNKSTIILALEKILLTNHRKGQFVLEHVTNKSRKFLKVSCSLKTIWKSTIIGQLILKKIVPWKNSLNKFTTTYCFLLKNNISLKFKKIKNYTPLILVKIFFKNLRLILKQLKNSTFIFPEKSIIFFFIYSTIGPCKKTKVRSVAGP